MVNVYKPHVWVLPEDDRNRQLINGFINHPAIDEGQIYPLPVAGGWSAVLKEFEEVYIKKLRDFQKAHVVLLIDYDNKFDTRRLEFQSKMPADVMDRAFVLGCADEPEALKKATSLGYEEIGRLLANECETGTDHLWTHDHLRHNNDDRNRLAMKVKLFLFRT
jgi:hypothetical protein